MTRILALAAAALVAAPAAAQQTTPAPGEPPARMGVGVGLSTNSSVPTFRFPMQLKLPDRATFLRVEPYFDLLQNDRDTSATLSQTDTFVDVGATVAFVGQVFPFAYGYGGGRLGLARHSISVENSAPGGTGASGSATGVLLAAVLGGDVYLHPRLSVGVEAGLGYQSSPKIADGNTVLSRKSTQIFTTGEVLLRFWFK